MAKKKGAGGKPQDYDKTNGQYAKELVSAIKKFSSEPELDIANAYIPQDKGYVNLPRQEYARLCSAVRTQFANRIPAKSAISLDEHYYLFSYNKKLMQVLCIGKIQIVGNEDIIKEIERNETRRKK